MSSRCNSVDGVLDQLVQSSGFKPWFPVIGTWRHTAVAILALGKVEVGA